MLFFRPKSKYEYHVGRLLTCYKKFFLNLGGGFEPLGSYVFLVNFMPSSSDPAHQYFWFLSENTRFQSA